MLANKGGLLINKYLYVNILVYKLVDILVDVLVNKSMLTRTGHRIGY